MVKPWFNCIVSEIIAYERDKFFRLSARNSCHRPCFSDGCQGYSTSFDEPFLHCVMSRSSTCSNGHGVASLAHKLGFQLLVRDDVLLILVQETFHVLQTRTFATPVVVSSVNGPEAIEAPSLHLLLLFLLLLFLLTHWHHWRCIHLPLQLRRLAATGAMYLANNAWTLGAIMGPCFPDCSRKR